MRYFHKTSTTEIPWRLIKGLRNHFAQGYAYTEMKDIFETATQDIPFLEQKFESILQAYENEEAMALEPEEFEIETEP